MIYNINIDEKLTIWARNKLTIEAETEEEAIQKAVEMVKNGDLDDGFDDDVLDDYEMMYDTSERLDPKENNGEATIEIWCDNGMKWDNVNKLEL